MESLSSGTKVTRQRIRKLDLSADDICKIISECKVAEVAELDFGPLHLKFHPRGNGDALIPGQGRDKTAEPLVSEPTSKYREELDLMNEQVLVDAAYAQLMIDDPMAYEKVQIQGDVERQRVDAG